MVWAGDSDLKAINLSDRTVAIGWEWGQVLRGGEGQHMGKEQGTKVQSLGKRWQEGNRKCPEE